MLIGNRRPRDFFRTAGVGESDITVHAGSYHLALLDAGIEMANIMTYSSILPATAREVAKPDRALFAHGEVMETITASATCGAGGTAVAGITFGWLYAEDGDCRGGLVCEFNGADGEVPDDVPSHLGDMLDELHTHGYAHLELRDRTTLVRSISPSKRFGTALVALCFLNYDIPVLEGAR